MKTRLFFEGGVTKPIFLATDLRDHLPDERPHHYRDGYSMAKGAKCWVEANGRLPQSIAELVGDGAFDTAHFEYPTKVRSGGTSRTDVMMLLRNSVIAVEHKARESFDAEVRT
jgi:hypothetical protein